MRRDVALTCPPTVRRRGILAGLLRWSALSRQRRQLARLDEAALRDLGLSRSDVVREARRKPWDAPAHWRD
ncbi:hypothetical protein AL036_13895 [Salipiger aestuarii]|uniref:Uncharacterized protein DUF1127 n=1 Tax=Salipiger aestuarii TaxID=568098 RepID=A0A327Y3W1_9RHOB|nr:DUF1127 domain-containing protein [Salipiger aestuarii]KAA8606610.1 hypothetical protein AL036_13895 [Salipiger aestuarii]KAA8609197.1 hypothetical protein AL037_15400 [Salipiger aestuarii]KAB2541247.1 hypothetical protein AL035_13225 [Salipiger aestuarii]RAK15127.1 uncharacterized protein DUF1127 [Salipiger aestuarii]